jgi:hypothetical protein
LVNRPPLDSCPQRRPTRTPLIGLERCELMVSVERAVYLAERPEVVGVSPARQARSLRVVAVLVNVETPRRSALAMSFERERHEGRTYVR